MRAVVLVAVAGLVAVPATGNDEPPSWKAVVTSQNNVKQIALAFHNYESAFAFFPQDEKDAKGKPLLSWRVLILPYIEQDALWKEFKLDEPWDSENNKKLLDQMPKVYAIPGQKAGANETHYRVFAGNGAAFEWVKGVRLIDYTDGTSNTIMVATAATAVPWTKPDELDYDPKKDPRPLLGAPGLSAPLFLMASADVRAVHKQPIERLTLDALIQRGDGLVIPDF